MSVNFTVAPTNMRFILFAPLSCIKAEGKRKLSNANYSTEKEKLQSNSN